MGLGSKLNLKRNSRGYFTTYKWVAATLLGVFLSNCQQGSPSTADTPKAGAAAGTPTTTATTPPAAGKGAPATPAEPLKPPFDDVISADGEIDHNQVIAKLGEIYDRYSSLHAFDQLALDTGNKSAIPRKPAPESSDCSGISTAKEKELNSRVSQLYTQFLQAQLSKESLQNEVQTVLAAQSDSASENDQRGLETTMANQALAALRTRIELKFLIGEELSAPDTLALKQLGVLDGLGDIKIEAERFRPYYELLKQKGITFSSKAGWQFSEASLKVSELTAPASEMATALRLFLGASIVEQIKDADRSKALMFGNGVFLPLTRPANSSKDLKEELSQVEVPIVTLEAYNARVKKYLSAFDRDTERFIVASKKRGTYSNLMMGQLGGGRGYKGQSAPEIEADDASRSMFFSREILQRTLGVPSELVDNLNQAVGQTNALDSANIDQGLAKIHAAKVAALSAPSIPIALYLAPVVAAAAGTGGVAAATTMMTATEGTLSLMGVTAAGQTAVVSMAAMPMIFSMGSVVMRAAVDSAHNQKPFWCTVADDGFTAGLESFSAGSKMALIPVGGQLVAATGMYFGGATVAAKSKAIFDTGAALYFLAQGGRSAVVGFEQCRQTVSDAHLVAHTEDDVAIVEALSAQAYKLCLQAGIDLAFTITATARMSVAARNAYRSANLPKVAGSQNKSVAPEVISKESNLIAAERKIPAEQVTERNNKILAALENETVEASGKRKVGLSLAEAREVLNRVKTNKVTGQTGKYDPKGGIGFCFGRALAAHLETLAMGVQKESVRKIWIVGTMETGGKITWGHHVATMVKATDGSWWVMDTYTNKLSTPTDWVAAVKSTLKPTNNPSIFISEPQRWGPNWPSPYSPGALNNDFYNGYFKDYLADFRSRTSHPGKRDPSSQVVKIKAAKKMASKKLPAKKLENKKSAEKAN